MGWRERQDGGLSDGLHLFIRYPHSLTLSHKPRFAHLHTIAQFIVNVHSFCSGAIWQSQTGRSPGQLAAGPGCQASSYTHGSSPLLYPDQLLVGKLFG
jgi:hypothetical protein